MRPRLAVILLLCLSGCYVPGRGYHESSFDLVLESRLPKFVDPDGHTSPRGYKATVDFYSSPSSVRVRVWTPEGNKMFDKHGQFWYPKEEPQPGSSEPQIYPNHTVVSFDGVLDILEQRKPGPTLYLTDDKQVWESLGEPPTASETPVNSKQ